MSRRIVALVSSLLLLPAGAGRADVIATFRANFVDNVCNVDDSEPFTAGDPDLRFRMAVFDQASTSIFTACASGCFDDGQPATLDGETVDRCGFTTTCGTWDFADLTLEKVVPNSSAVWFYFGLFDDDSDADDSMGDHWFGAGSSASGTVWNNNGSPYYPGAGFITTVCGDDVAEIGWANNYRLNWSVSFRDTDGPLPMSAPVAQDNGLPVTVDNDLRLDFTWTPATDPNTGISARTATLFDQTAGSTIFSNQPAPSSAASVCASGCNFTYTPVDGHTYRFTVHATNGAFPAITNPSSVTSPPATILVQLPPVGVGEVAQELSLAAPAPNPTSAGASIAYTLPVAGHARLEVIDLQGRRVATLREGTGEAGPHRVEWNGSDEAGHRVDSGVYWVRLGFAGERRLQRLVVVR